MHLVDIGQVGSSVGDGHGRGSHKRSAGWRLGLMLVPNAGGGHPAAGSGAILGAGVPPAAPPAPAAVAAQTENGTLVVRKVEVTAAGKRAATRQWPPWRSMSAS